MTEPRLTEPDDGSYVSISYGENTGRVYKRMNLLAWGSEARWFQLTDNNPHGIPIEGEAGLTWAEVLAAGIIGYIGGVR